LIGVGGGEFRIPVLLHVLRLPVRVAAGANTVIGLFVVVLSVARRWGEQRLSPISTAGKIINRFGPLAHEFSGISRFKPLGG